MHRRLAARRAAALRFTARRAALARPAVADGKADGTAAAAVLAHIAGRTACRRAAHIHARTAQGFFAFRLAVTGGATPTLAAVLAAGADLVACPAMIPVVLDLDAVVAAKLAAARANTLAIDAIDSASAGAAARAAMRQIALEISTDPGAALGSAPTAAPAAPAGARPTAVLATAPLRRHNRVKIRIRTGDQPARGEGADDRKQAAAGRWHGQEPGKCIEVTIIHPALPAYGRRRRSAILLISGRSSLCCRYHNFGVGDSAKHVLAAIVLIPGRSRQQERVVGAEIANGIA